MKPLPRIIIILLATSITPGIVYNLLNALSRAVDPRVSETALQALIDPAAAIDLFKIAWLPGLAFVLSLMWWERKYDSLTFSDYLFGGCLCACFAITLSTILMVFQISLYFRDGGEDTLSIPLIIGLIVGLAVAYYLRPLDRRILKGNDDQ